MRTRSQPPPEPDPEWDIELEIDPVFEWRQAQLQAAGFTRFTAFRLAMVTTMDWHQAVDMLRAGASEDTVLDLFLDY